jgi:hypothetical protein
MVAFNDDSLVALGDHNAIPDSFHDRFHQKRSYLL